jgi:hypothetical protein
MKKYAFATITVIALTLLLGQLNGPKDNSQAAAPEKKSVALLANVQDGNPEFSRIGRMSFGPQGILLIADPGAAAVVAIDTGDKGPVLKLKKRVDQVDLLVDGALGAEPGGSAIVDMAVNPASGLIYLSVHRKQDNKYAILTVNADGKIGVLDLDKARYVKIPLPQTEQVRIRNITGVEFAKNRVLAAGQSNEEFASKIFSLPLPLTHGKTANIFSTETFHVAHNRWETKAPIQSFVPFEDNGKSYVVGSFNCTPIARFPIDNLKSGAQIKGTSVVELGSGNRPIDMFTYKRDGKQWLITNTDRFHHERKPLGPSQYWGVRVDMSYLAEAENVNEEAARRLVSEKAGPEGIEVVEELFFAKHVDKLNDNEMVVLRDNKGHLDLEISKLP